MSPTKPAALALPPFQAVLPRATPHTGASIERRSRFRPSACTRPELEEEVLTDVFMLVSERARACME